MNKIEDQLLLDKQKVLDRFEKIRRDPIEFLKCVFTLDQVDFKTPIKRFPYDLEYLHWYIRTWQRERLLAVPKSRRMKMSWTNIALFLWEALFNVGRDFAFVSKKEEDSNELVNRAEFIYDHLDPKLLPKDLLPAKRKTFCRLEFPEIQSRINGYPSGADQLRQFTFSGIFGDESAFWSDAQEMFKASYPTVEGGGRFVMVSSPAPGFFKRLVYDQLEHQGDFDPESVMGSISKSPAQGVEVWKNPNNGFCVFQLHYTADPSKRSNEWKKGVKRALPIRDWLQEYELHWESYNGLPVYGDWNKKIHVKRGLSPHSGLPILRGWDFGLTPACVIAQLQGDILVVFHEFTEMNMGADRFSDLVLKKCAVLFPEWHNSGKFEASHWVDYIDPAGMNRDQTDEGTCARILDSKGLNCIPGPISFETRRKSVETFLTKFVKGEICFQLDPETCPVLLRGFEGGYRYSENVQGREPKLLRPMKDEHSHPHDALQYLAGGILENRNRLSVGSVPRIGYAFGKDLDYGKQRSRIGPTNNFKL